MKKIQTILCGTLAALALSACSSEDNEFVSDDQTTFKGARTYTVTTEAQMGGDAESRALAIDGDNISATFATTENVYVFNTSAVQVGTLQPQANGNPVTLKGTVDGTIAVDDDLKLTYPKNAVVYTGQKGTLEDIAENFDFACATVKVTAIDGDNLTTEAATFTSMQSITKFTFTNGSTPINVKSLTISGTGLVQSIAADGTETTGEITVTLATPSNEVFVAMRNNSDAKQEYTFTARDASGNKYSGTKSAKLQNGKNYATGVTLTSYVGNWFGSGTSADPWQICTKAELDALRTAVNGGTNQNGKYFKLTADIDCGSGWTPIGTYVDEYTTKPFKGTFDGNGHNIHYIITGATVTCQGLFGYINSATIKNLRVSGSITGTKASYGGIAGNSAGSSTITNCYSAVNITGTSPTISSTNYGGIVGFCSSTNVYPIRYCLATGTITNPSSKGGIVALLTTSNSSSWVENCTFTGTVNSGSDVGMICGKHNGEGSISNCYYRYNSDGIYGFGSSGTGSNSASYYYTLSELKEDVLAGLVRTVGVNDVYYDCINSLHD